jgi:hypothetical protein
VQGYRTAEAYYAKHKLPGVFRYAKGKGHTYLQEYNAEAVAYLAKNTRRRYPKEFPAIFFVYSNAMTEKPLNSRAYWLEGEEFSPDVTVIAVSVQGNVITIDAPALQSAHLLLNDAIVDLDKPVTVKLNGKTVFEGPVERSVPFLLDWFATNRDRGDLYWNRIRIAG